MIWIYHIHAANRGIDKRFNEDVEKLPVFYMYRLSLFDEVAYQKALEHKGLDEDLCSPVLALKVSEKKNISLRDRDQSSTSVIEENKMEKNKEIPFHQPNYVVCTYNPKDDWISMIINVNGAYEPQLSRQFLEVAYDSGTRLKKVSLQPKDKFCWKAKREAESVARYSRY